MQIPRLVFAAGAAAGAGLALAGLFLPGDPRLDAADPAVARINGHAISAHDLNLALEAMAADSRNPLPGDARAHALSRLIDEELLFQRAIELDLPRNASTIRRSVVIAMIDAVIARADREPQEAELIALFEAEPERFGGEPRLQVEWESAPAGTSDFRRPPAHPPARLMSATDLRRYLGEDLTLAALTLQRGETSDLIAIGDRIHRLHLTDRVMPPPPDFDRQREAVLALWRERAQEAALESYLADLRADADIAIAR